MHVKTIIWGVIILLIVSTVVWFGFIGPWLEDKHRKEKAIRNRSEWHSRFDKLTQDLRRLRANPASEPGFDELYQEYNSLYDQAYKRRVGKVSWDEIYALQNHVRARNYWHAAEKKVAAALAGWQIGAEDESAKLVVLSNWYSKIILRNEGSAKANRLLERTFGDRLRAAAQRYDELTQAEYDRLVEAASNSREGFVELNAWLLKSACHEVRGKFKLPRLMAPQNWSELVARFQRNPNRHDFKMETYTVGRYTILNPLWVNQGRRDIPRGQMRLRAAKALRIGSTLEGVTEAKIVLAFCNDREAQWFKVEVGDVLLAELAKLVEAYNAAHADEMKPVPATT